MTLLIHTLICALTVLLIYLYILIQCTTYCCNIVERNLPMMFYFGVCSLAVIILNLLEFKLHFPNPHC